MANRNFPASRQFGFNLMPVRISGSISIGSSGAVSSFSALGVNDITQDGTGIYKIKLQDNYAALLRASFQWSAPVTSSAVDPAGVTVGTLVQITTVGNSDWATAGIPSGITPAVGQAFALLAQPGSGTGRVKPVGDVGIDEIDLAPSPNSFLAPSPTIPLSGGYVIFRCQQIQMPSATTQATPIQKAAADPASGSVIFFELLLNNSAVQ